MEDCANLPLSVVYALEDSNDAHATKAQDIWQKFRDVRNLLKKKIREARQNFINKALSSKKPRGVAGYLPYSAPKSYTLEVQCRCSK